MKFNITLLVLASLLLAIGFASADSANVYVDQVTNNVSTVTVGNSVVMTFVLKNTFNQDLENIKFNLPTNLQSIGSFESAKIGTGTVQVSNNQVLYIGKVSSGTSSNVIALTFKVNSNAVVGKHNGLVNIAAIYGTSGSVVTIAPLSFSLNVVPVTPNPALSIVQLSPALSYKVSSTKIALNNTGNILLSNIVFNITGSLNVTISSGTIQNLAAGIIGTALDVNTDLSKLNFGENSATITARASDGTSANVGYNIRKTFCSNGQISTNLTIKNADITEYNEKIDTWKPADKITFEVEVKSNVRDSDNIVIEMGFFNENGVNVVDDLVFTNKDKEQADIGNIGDGSETATFEFRVPADMEKGNYRLAVKTYSDDEGEEKVCNDNAADFGSSSYFKPIKVENEKEEGRYILFDNMRTTPTQAICGDPVVLTTDVYNIGTKKQDQVRVNLFNRELGVNQKFEIKKDLNVGDKQKGVSFTFVVPKNAIDKSYNLELSADYNFDKSQDEYDLSSDSNTNVPLKIFGCTPAAIDTTGKRAEIVASVDSEVVSGKNVVIKSTIRNLGNTTAKYALGVKGIDSWATLSESSARIIDLAPGQSKEVTFTLSTKAEIKGEQTLTIEAVSDRTDTKTFSVTFPESTSKGFDFGGNTLLWVVGIMNVVLLILIILVAVRISRR